MFNCSYMHVIKHYILVRYKNKCNLVKWRHLRAISYCTNLPQVNHVCLLDKEIYFHQFTISHCWPQAWWCFTTCSPKETCQHAMARSLRYQKGKYPSSEQISEVCNEAWNISYYKVYIISSSLVLKHQSILFTCSYQLLVMLSKYN